LLQTGVVSLVKLLVREKAGAEGRGLYLICSGPAEPEMFELRVHRPKDIHAWIQAIRLLLSFDFSPPYTILNNFK
jgi:A-kinase anchor protein 18